MWVRDTGQDDLARGGGLEWMNPTLKYVLETAFSSLVTAAARFPPAPPPDSPRQQPADNPLASKSKHAFTRRALHRARIPALPAQ